MTWKTRLRDKITLTSPKKKVFNAAWQKSPRVKSKSLGRFKYPGVEGAFLQDLDVGEVLWTQTILFEGKNHDLEAELFWKACDENGKWTITHPVKGLLNLQLSTVSEAIDPTGSGNITAFETEWLESIDELKVTTAPQLAQEVLDMANQVNASAASQFDNNIVQDTAGTTQAVRNTTEQVQTSSDLSLGDLAKQSTEVNARFNEIQNQVTATISEPIIDALQLAGQTQQLIQAPALAINDIRARINAYINMAADIFGLSPSGITEVDKNTASTQELSIASLLVGACTSSVIGSFDTRNEALESASLLITLLDDSTAALDASQENFLDTPIDKQFISQSEAYPDLVQIVGLSVAYLLSAAFELKIEKRYKIKQDEAPIKVCIENYGELGESDSIYDLFISTNNLENNELILLPAGFEVVVYV